MNFQYGDDQKYSVCCHALDRIFSKNGALFSDMQICPMCGENTEFLTQEEMEREDDSGLSVK